jgi:1-phosphofructokinase family hexose kinase
MIYTITLNPCIDRTLIVPEIELNQVLRANDIKIDWGGKGFNVSRALKVLGKDSLAMGFVGGNNGAQIEKGFKELGIQTDFVHIDGETRINTVIMEETGNIYVKVNEPGPRIKQTEINDFIEKIDRYLGELPTKRDFSPIVDNKSPSDYWVISGSLPSGVPEDFYALLITRIQKSGALVFFDSSGGPFKAGLQACPYLVKPNLEELEEVLDTLIISEEELHKSASLILEKGVQIVLVSLGIEGLFTCSQKASFHLRPPIIGKGNPTGAGDALLAGLVWGLESGKSLEESASWGVACGTAAAVGSNVGLPSFDDVKKIRNMLG